MDSFNNTPLTDVEYQVKMEGRQFEGTTDNFGKTTIIGDYKPSKIELTLIRQTKPAVSKPYQG